MYFRDIENIEFKYDSNLSFTIIIYKSYNDIKFLKFVDYQHELKLYRYSVTSNEEEGLTIITFEKNNTLEKLCKIICSYDTPHIYIYKIYLMST